jgi:hypothetical protein
MNNASFPNTPFAASFDGQAKEPSLGVIDIIAAGQAHGLIESSERDAEHRRREAQRAYAMEQIAQDKELVALMDYYDGHAKLERGQGNRKFVLGVAKGACAVVATIAVAEILFRVARSS